MPSSSFTGIHFTFTTNLVGEDLVSSRLHRNPFIGEPGRYKIGPYIGFCNGEVAIANEEEGTRPSPTDDFF